MTDDGDMVVCGRCFSIEHDYKGITALKHLCSLFGVDGLFSRTGILLSVVVVIVVEMSKFATGEI